MVEHFKVQSVWWDVMQHGHLRILYTLKLPSRWVMFHHAPLCHEVILFRSLVNFCWLWIKALQRSAAQVEGTLIAKCGANLIVAWPGGCSGEGIRPAFIDAWLFFVYVGGSDQIKPKLNCVSGCGRCLSDANESVCAWGNRLCRKQRFDVASVRDLSLSIIWISCYLQFLCAVGSLPSKLYNN